MWLMKTKLQWDALSIVYTGYHLVDYMIQPLNNKETNGEKTQTHGYVVTCSLDYCEWQQIFFLFCLHTVDAHHRGINERKNTLKEMFIFIWPELKLCKFVEGTNRANLLQIQLGCSAVVQKIKERRKRLIKTNAMH